MAKTNCSVKGCEKPRYYSREWCVMHYRRWQRNGDPLARKVYRGDPAGSLKAHSQNEGECVIWTGSTTYDGYGTMKVRGASQQVHRVAWELSNGPIPDGAEIDHSCHRRACINPEHLRQATASENQWNRSESRSSTGHRNVYATKGGGYYVQIRHGGRKVGYGSYSDLSEAAEAARRGRAELFGDFAGNG